MIVFDEKKYAEKLLRQGYMTKNKNVFELNTLAKYYFSERQSKEEVKENLIRFCEKHDKHFNIDEWYKIINSTVLYAQKGKLVTGKEVHITEIELEYIKQLEKINEQKVAFVLLVLFKFYDYKKFEVSIEDLYRLGKLNLNSKTKLEILQSLTSKEMIDITMGGKRFVKFAEKKGMTVIVIRNFDDFIYEYLKYIGIANIINCETCDKAIVVTSNRSKYCRDCWKDVERVQTKERVKNHRLRNALDNSENPYKH